jgi:hypothetical protein
MNDLIQTILTELQKRFGAGVYEFRDESSAVISPENIVPAARALRDEFTFNLLTEETA